MTATNIITSIISKQLGLALSVALICMTSTSTMASSSVEFTGVVEDRNVNQLKTVYTFIDQAGIEVFPSNRLNHAAKVSVNVTDESGNPVAAQILPRSQNLGAGERGKFTVIVDMSGNSSRLLRICPLSDTFTKTDRCSTYLAEKIDY